MLKKMFTKLKPQHIIAIKVVGVIIKIVVFAFILTRVIGAFNTISAQRASNQAARTESSSESYWNLSEEKKSAYWDAEYAKLESRVDGLMGRLG